MYLWCDRVHLTSHTDAPVESSSTALDHHAHIDDDIVFHTNHGHSHHEHVANMSIRSLVLLAGLSVHSVLEGVAIGLQQSAQAYWQLVIAVMLHEVLCALAYGFALVQQSNAAGDYTDSKCVSKSTKDGSNYAPIFESELVITFLFD